MHSHENRIPNKLINETSPYLLQHVNNPVDWYPWGEEAFEKAEREDKPIFLSIGYSTCHWCHVMAHESFEDDEVADILNQNFISIKVDKEERPDIDSIYMSVCQAYTGSGGWPLTIIMTPQQKPFYAGTYFPKHSLYGNIGFIDLLLSVKEKWARDREKLMALSDEVMMDLNNQPLVKEGSVSKPLVEEAVDYFKKTFDEMYGGFGAAPKFPTPHNLLFLLNYYEITKDQNSLQMAEKTLLSMYKGGLFDHIGFGFSRYSTDRQWLAPHFEKMLYDNALLTLAYLKAYQVTKKELYKTVAVKTMDYVLRELTCDEGGFFCAQDADSDGVEGKYYVFTPDEIKELLGKEEGTYFNHYFDITREGNFEGKNIPNLINCEKFDPHIETLIPTVYEYRKTRTTLHKDDKILTSWNALMISAFANAYKLFDDEKYLIAANRAIAFIDQKVSNDKQLFVSYRDGKTSKNAFLDDYSFYIYAQINMYEATFNTRYLEKAIQLNDTVMDCFYDKENSGFFLYGKDNEQLILKPKETYDGALPSGNSMMTYNLLKLARLTKNPDLETLAHKQLNFMANHASHYPGGYSFYMLSLLLVLYDSKEIVCVLKDKDELEELKALFPSNAIISILDKETIEYPLLNNKTTFYVCENNRCLPPTNTI